MQSDRHLTQLLDAALAVHQSSDFDQAAALYTKILAQYPGQADALYLFGVLRHQTGHYGDAVGLIREAINKNQRNPDWYNTLGEAHRALGQLDDAIRAYRRALQLAPGQVAALGNLGLALHDQGKLRDAAQIYEQVLRIDPQSLPALINLGSIYQEQGSHSEAVARYRSALRLDQNCVDAHFNLGLLHHERWRYEEAQNHLQLVTQLIPNHFDAWLALGKAYLKLTQHANAVRALERALALHPDYPEADFQLAVALVQLGQHEAAQRHFQRVVSYCRNALAIQANDAQKHCLLGNALRELGEKDEALACFRQAIALEPHHGEALFNLGSLLLEARHFEEARHLFGQAILFQPEHPEAYLNNGLVLQQMGELAAARASLLVALHQRPKFPLAELNLGLIHLDMGLVEDSLVYTRRAVEAMPDDSRAHSNLLLTLNYTVRPAEQMFCEHLSFGERFAGPYRIAPRSWPNQRDTVRALRVGYLSPDFRTHSVAYFTEPILASHDRARFEVFCYADAPQGDAVTARLQRYWVNWRDIHQLSDQQVYERIRDDKIDILVDLAGHTAKNRMMVFARKSAPIQVSYVGYPNTTGLAEMDYRFTDAWADPEGQTDPFYTEKLIRLSCGFLCYQPDARSPLVSELPALALGRVTFGSFNNLTKVTDEMIVLWSRVLNSVPDSRFIFKSKALADNEVRERIAHLFAEQGVDQSRLDLLAQIPSTNGHLAAYHGMDIALDTFPYHGTTTTFEALWMGTPVVVLAGETHVARVGVSILSRVGLPELIASTPENYVRIAVDLAGDLSRLRRLRGTLRQRMEEHGLLDGKTITRELESAYRDMWRCYCASK